MFALPYIYLYIDIYLICIIDVLYVLYVIICIYDTCIYDIDLIYR